MAIQYTFICNIDTRFYNFPLNTLSLIWLEPSWMPHHLPVLTLATATKLIRNRCCSWNLINIIDCEKTFNFWLNKWWFCVQDDDISFHSRTSAYVNLKTIFILFWMYVLHLLFRTKLKRKKTLSSEPVV